MKIARNSTAKRLAKSLVIHAERADDHLRTFTLQHGLIGHKLMRELRILIRLAGTVGKQTQKTPRPVRAAA